MPKKIDLDTAKLKFRLEEELNRSEDKRETINKIMDATGWSRTKLYRLRITPITDETTDITYSELMTVCKILDIHTNDFYKKNVKMSFRRTA